MKRYYCSLFVLLSFYTSPIFAQQHMQTEILGNTESIQKQNNVLIIKTKEAEARIWVYSPTIIRVSISKEHSADTSFAVIQKPSENLDYTESAVRMIRTLAQTGKVQEWSITASFITMKNLSGWVKRQAI